MLGEMLDDPVWAMFCFGCDTRKGPFDTEDEAADAMHEHADESPDCPGITIFVGQTYWSALEEADVPEE